MKTPTAQNLRQHRYSEAPLRPLRIRAELPALPGVHDTIAQHDFLVPNPRPDLILDPQILRMIELR